MCRATLILTVLFFGSNFGAGKTSLASEARSSVATETDISSPIETSQGQNLLRRLAIALSAGGEALGQFRGPTMKTEEEENFFSPTMPGLDCSVSGIANYVSCYGSVIGNKDEADRRFIRLIHELQAVLPSDGWRGIETDPGIDAIRSYTYESQNSDAHIDVDLIAKMATEGETSYLVTIFGWPATEPQL